MQPRQVAGLAFDDLDRPLRVLGIGRPLELEHLHGVADGRERVPQLVGEHGQELVLAAVGLAEGDEQAFPLRLDLPALRDVQERADAAARPPLLVEQRRHALEQLQDGPVVEDDVDLHVALGDAPGRRGLHRQLVDPKFPAVAVDLEIPGPLVLGRRQRRVRAPGKPKQLRQQGIHPDRLAGRVFGDADADRQDLDQGHQFGRAAFQRLIEATDLLLRPLPLGDVLGDVAEPIAAVGVTTDVRDHDAQPADGAVVRVAVLEQHGMLQPLAAPVGRDPGLDRRAWGRPDPHDPTAPRSAPRDMPKNREVAGLS